MSQECQQLPPRREIHIELHAGGGWAWKIGVNGALLGRVPTLIDALRVARVRAETSTVHAIIIHDDEGRTSVHQPHTV